MPSSRRTRSNLFAVDVSPLATDDPAAENETLRARVAALETQLSEQAARANAAVASAQQRIYWLDRWHIDLDRMLQRPVARHLPALIDGLRRSRHKMQRVKRRLTGG